MLQGLFPDDVTIAWGDPHEPSAPLFPEEEALVRSAIPKRQREFAKGRECARRALASLGHGDVMVLAGERREPLWPSDVVGSITHTEGLCAVAVARSERYLGVGIDAEPAEPLSPELARRVCQVDEAEALAGLSELAEDVAFRLVFSAKEAVYKCVFPAAKRFLGFGDVRVRFENATFRARLLVDAPPFRAGCALDGRWRRIGRGDASPKGEAAHLVTAAWIPRDRASLP